MLILGILFAIGAIALCSVYGGGLTPGICLLASWAFVYVIQGLFADDMYFSPIAGVVVSVLCVAFIFGEYLGTRGYIAAENGVNAEIIRREQVALPARFRRNLAIIIIVAGLYSMFATVNYYLLLRGFASGSDDSILLSGVREAIFADEIQLPAYIRAGITIAYVGVMFVLIYWVLFGWRFYFVLPVLSVILFGFSQSGRAGTIIIMLQAFAATYFRDLFFHRANPIRRFASRTFTLMAIGLIVFVGGQMLREGGEGSADDFVRIFHNLRGYLLGGISAFSYYVDHWMSTAPFSLGRYTFSSLYQALGLFVQAPGVYDEYAPISVTGETTNLYTAYRSLIDDFTIAGAIIFCVVMGFYSGRFFAGAMKGNFKYFGPIISLYTWALFSPLFSLTYFNSFLAAIILPWICIAYMSRKAVCAKYA
jgi:oligosaccharide repeat unit polymerase